MMGVMTAVKHFPLTIGSAVGYFGVEIVLTILDPYRMLDSWFILKILVGVAIMLLGAALDLRKMLKEEEARENEEKAVSA